MSTYGSNPINTYEDFCSAFVTPAQRRQFLLDCAHAGFKSIRQAWPDSNPRMFVFGSTARHPVRVGANSDLDIAISGLNHIAGTSKECRAILKNQFRKGLPIENKILPFDLLIFDAEKPATQFALEIIKNGIEIKP